MSSSSHSHAGSRQFPGNCTLEKALTTVVDVFHQYSIRQGEIDLLSLSDFRTLLTEQAPSFLGSCVSAGGTIPPGWGAGLGFLETPRWGSSHQRLSL
ncbi:protein S100-A2-like [Parus major]|uniref:protein S100-A2-like n=1 Tax=Parus major TaxID=9157 RepID=UPI00144391AC|nr:protein S100-A2-like [Parus major]